MQTFPLYNTAAAYTSSNLSDSLLENHTFSNLIGLMLSALILNVEIYLFVYLHPSFEMTPFPSIANLPHAIYTKDLNV